MFMWCARCAFAAVAAAGATAIPAVLLAQDVSVVVELTGTNRLMPPWRVLRESGSPAFETEDGGNRVRLLCANASFGLQRPLLLNPAEHPVLRWEWRMDVLPPRGGDRALGLMVLFERAGFGDRGILYVIDSADPRPPLARPGARSGRGGAAVVVEEDRLPGIQLRTKAMQVAPDSLRDWVANEHDVVADFWELFGEAPERVTGIRLQTECWRPQSEATVSFRNVRFVARPVPQ